MESFVQCVYEAKVHDIDELKTRLLVAWLVGISQRVIDDAIDERRKRLRACVRAKGRKFEHQI